jgi:hypothetical protein
MPARPHARDRYRSPAGVDTPMLLPRAHGGNAPQKLIYDAAT